MGDVRAETDCVTCHMLVEGRRDVPHLSAVDHWIRARPQRDQRQTAHSSAAQSSDAPLVWSADPQVNPTDPDHQLLLGRAYYKAWRQGAQLADLHSAYRMLTQALPHRLDAVEGWVTLAALADEMSESHKLPALGGRVGAELARDAAERALTLEPLHPTTAPLLSALYMKIGQPRRALQVITPLLERDPHRVELLRLKARALSALGARGEAEQNPTHALSLDPFSAWVRFELGLSAQAAQAWPKARARFTALLKLEPAWREAWLNLGWVELQSGRGEEALAAWCI